MREPFVPTTELIDERIRAMKSNIANNPPDDRIDCLHCKTGAAVMKSEEAAKLAMKALKIYAQEPGNDPLTAFVRMYALGMADGIQMVEARELERFANG